MNKKAPIILLVGLLFFLAACAPAATPAPTQAPQGFGSGGSGGNGGNASGSPRPLNEETKLAIGIFKLEGTSNAVTAAEAKTLIPLWQQVQTLSANASSAQTDLQAVYTQIQGALTPDQVNAINGMNLTQADVQSMMQQLGIQVTPGAFGGNGGNGGTPFPTLSPDERATRTAQRQTQVAGNGGSGGGYPAPNGTPGAGGRGGGFGFSNMFLNPLITLLQTRASS